MLSFVQYLNKNLSRITSHRSMMHNKAAELGIVSLETAGDFSKASAIISSWRIDTVLIHNNTVRRNLLHRAKINVWWDFLFIVFYTGFAIVLVSWLSERVRPVINE